MVKKLHPKSAKSSASTSTDMPSSIKDSAQQIWQAGLAAFNRAQTEGGKAFEALVKEGVGIQRKTQSAAEEKINEATQKMSNMASDISSKASGQWDKLENIFEERVAKALNKLGVPSAKDVKALIERIDALQATVQKLSPKVAAKSAPKAAAKAGTKAGTKTAAKAPVKSPAKSPAKAPVAKKAVAKKPAAKAATSK
jgi:poly(hydroxyalkanoate) granule-associated protein